MYAFVRFFEDDMCDVLPSSDVENFRPLHKTDFDNQKVYLVHRSEENGSAGQPCEAHILALAGKIFSLIIQCQILELYFSISQPVTSLYMETCRGRFHCPMGYDSDLTQIYLYLRPRRVLAAYATWIC